MDEQNRNLILATVLSFLVILGWFVLFPPEKQTQTNDTLPAQETVQADGVATTPMAADGARPGRWTLVPNPSLMRRGSISTRRG